jgi:hypothetical protein
VENLAAASSVMAVGMLAPYATVKTVFLRQIEESSLPEKSRLI